MNEEASRHGFITQAAGREGVGSDLVLLIGRVLMAAIYLYGGSQKLTGLDGFAEYLAGQGVAVGVYPIALVAVGVEFFGALCVLVGFGTRYAAAVMALFTVAAALGSGKFPIRRCTSIR
jgi:putative oxidoreductase